MLFLDLGKNIDYDQAYKLQLYLLNSKQSNRQKEDILIFVQHNNVFTAGRNGKNSNLLVNKNELENMNIKLKKIDRGGDITYHGPGQLLCYPIINLENFKKDTHYYIEFIENIVIQTCKYFNLECYVDAQYPGVWFDNKKICSIGVAIKKWITYHGFALNVNTDLNYFNMIIPCGIKGRETTSIKKEIGENVSMDLIKKLLAKSIEDNLKIKVLKTNIKEIQKYYAS